MKMSWWPTNGIRMRFGKTRYILDFRIQSYTFRCLRWWRHRIGYCIVLCSRLLASIGKYDGCSLFSGATRTKIKKKIKSSGPENNTLNLILNRISQSGIYCFETLRLNRLYAVVVTLFWQRAIHVLYSLQIALHKTSRLVHHLPVQILKVMACSVSKTLKQRICTQRYNTMILLKPST